MEIYYEVSEHDYSRAFDTLEETIVYCEQHNIKTISEVGGNYTDFERCEFCGEWVDCCDLDDNNYCSECQQALKSKGEY